MLTARRRQCTRPDSTLPPWRYEHAQQICSNHQATFSTLLHCQTRSWAAQLYRQSLYASVQVKRCLDTSVHGVVIKFTATHIRNQGITILDITDIMRHIIPLAIPLRASSLVITLITLLSGCASINNPDKLAMPETMTCIYFKDPMSFFSSRGLLSPIAETRLARGPYISEKVDDKGTYYRSPPGGYSGWPYSMGKADPNSSRDGGFWIPHDHRVTPRLYSYVSMTPVPSQAVPDDVNCLSFTQTKDPVTTKVKLAPLATTGAIVGGLGGVSAKNQGHTQMSYVDSTGAGMVGGAISMLIIGAIINYETGKIALYPWPENEDIDRLRRLATEAITIKAVSSDTPLASSITSQ